MYNTIMMLDLEQTLKKGKNLNIIDVREADEYESGHIKGAIHVPLSNFLEAMKVLDKKTNYYVVCFSGSRSQMATQHLSSQGYKVTNVMGGMSTYKGELDYGM